jgi:hypothetical protein
LGRSAQVASAAELLLQQRGLGQLLQLCLLPILALTPFPTQ